MTTDSSKLATPIEQAWRATPEGSDNLRDIFQHDRDRIIHSKAFRRLIHKTQVFMVPEGDHFRTRLTHSLEVAQIARTMARYFLVNEDLAETIALAHDLGHPPFGHHGETILDGLVKKAGDKQGFDHNNQTLRIIMVIEHRYPDFIGLNLSNFCLEGLAKHNGAFSKNAILPPQVKKLFDDMKISKTNMPGLEAQIAAEADDIAYNAHDIDDGIRSNILSIKQITDNITWIAQIVIDIEKSYQTLDKNILKDELIRRIINIMVNDMITASKQKIMDNNIRDYTDIIGSKEILIGFSNKMASQSNDLKTFLSNNLYSHHALEKKKQIANQTILKLFEKRKSENKGTPREIADYIAGMTDSFAIDKSRLDSSL